MVEANVITSGQIKGFDLRVLSMLTDMLTDMLNGRTPIPAIKIGALCEFTDDELMNELHRRGFLVSNQG